MGWFETRNSPKKRPVRDLEILEILHYKSSFGKKKIFEREPPGGPGGGWQDNELLGNS